MATTNAITFINKLIDESVSNLSIHVSSAQDRTDPDISRFARASFRTSVMVSEGYLGIKIPAEINFQINVQARISLTHFQTFFQTERDGTRVGVYIYKVDINPVEPKPLGDIEIVEPEQDEPILED